MRSDGRRLPALAVVAVLLVTLTGCGSKGDAMGDCTGTNLIHQGGSSSAVTEPRLPSGAPVLLVSGGHISGQPPASQLYLTVIPAGEEDSETPGTTKAVKLQVGETASYLGFTVKVTGICDLTTTYDATVDPSVAGVPSPTASPTP